MKALLFSTGILLLACQFAVAQKNHAVNIRIDADDNKITISYDLNPDGQYRYFDVTLETGNALITPRTVSGDVGQRIPAGINKVIKWYYPEDNYTKNDLSGLAINILAINPLDPMVVKPSKDKSSAPTVPIYAGIGGIGVTGIGLVTAGAITESNAQNDYDIYKNNLDPNASVYIDDLGLTRDELYDDANSRHKRAQWLMAGGGAVIVAAGVILVNRIVIMNKIKKGRLSLSPVIAPEVQPAVQSGPGIGLKLKYRFK